MDAPIKTINIVDENDDPRYAVYSDDWSPDFIGIDAQDDSDADFAGILGIPITKFTVGAKGISGFRIRTKKKDKWMSFQHGFDKDNAISDNTPITGIEILGSNFMYAVHILGGQWLPAITSSDVEGVRYAGIGAPIDAIWIEKV